MFELTPPSLKPLFWIGSAYEDFTDFPRRTQEEAGYALYLAQRGGKAHHAKPLKGLAGVMEIVTRHDTDTYRSVYAVNIGEAIYVLHAFKKKSHHGSETSKQEIDLIRQRLKKAQNYARGH